MVGSGPSPGKATTWRGLTPSVLGLPSQCERREHHALYADGGQHASVPLSRGEASAAEAASTKRPPGPERDAQSRAERLRLWRLNPSLARWQSFVNYQRLTRSAGLRPAPRETREGQTFNMIRQQPSFYHVLEDWMQ